MTIPDLDLLRIRHFVDARNALIPAGSRQFMRIEAEVGSGDGDADVTILDRRAPWDADLVGPEWTRKPVARLSYDRRPPPVDALLGRPGPAVPPLRQGGALGRSGRPARGDRDRPADGFLGVEADFPASRCRESGRSFDLWVSGATGAPPTRKDGAMRFMLLQNYGEVESGCPPMTEWTPEDIKAHIEFQQVLNQELTERGELVDAQGLAGPDQAKFVVSDGVGAPVDHRRPVPRVEGAARRLPPDRRRVRSTGRSRSRRRRRRRPGPNGVPIRDRIEVRQVMSAPDPEV